ncbi:MAG: hypothetical protein LBJ25_07600 [Candidatus Margulisbacteria bacterium]|jgi:hypothetical protein|nr:hypothetical protein [Candidatus Margulisiibacteriota bacterium]
MVDGINGNQPSFNVLKIQGGTVAKDERTTNIAQSVKSDILKETSKGLQDATSKLMDLWLEDTTDQKLNAVLTILQDELPSDVFSQFNDSYLQPSVNVMSKISAGSKVAEQFDYSVSVKSAENLKKAGIHFHNSKHGGVLDVTFASNAMIKDKSDGESVEGSRWTYIFDGSEEGVEISEQEDGSFELKITYPKVANKQPDVYTITVPDSTSINPSSSSYTPGTRYAVVSKNEINYTLSK